MAQPGLQGAPILGGQGMGEAELHSSEPSGGTGSRGPDSLRPRCPEPFPFCQKE